MFSIYKRFKNERNCKERDYDVHFNYFYLYYYIFTFYLLYLLKYYVYSNCMQFIVYFFNQLNLFYLSLSVH